MRNAAPQPHGERGAVLILTALALSVLLAFTSIAVDLGYQRVARRDMQALADVVALDMVRMVDGRTVAAIEADPLWLQGRDDSVARNSDTQGDDPEVTPILGTVDPSTRVFTEMTGSQVPNAVKVIAQTDVDYFFRPGSGGATRSAIAGGDDVTVDYQLGSFLAGLSPFQNGLLQLVLSQAFCPDGTGGTSCRAALDVLSYQGLVNTRVTLGALATQLGFGSPEELLASNVSVRNLLQASALALPAGAPPTASATLNGLAAQLSSAGNVRLGDFIDVAQGNGVNAAQASVDILGIILGSAFLIDGDSLVTIPGATVGINGVGSMTVRLRVVETVQYRFGARVGDPPLTTGQIQLDVTLNIEGLSVLGLVNALSGTQTISVVVGGASAPLTLARCASPAQANIAVTPQAAALVLNQNLTVLGLGLFGAQLPLATITTTNLRATAQGTTQTGQFAYPSAFLPQVGSGTTQRLGSTQLGLAGLLGPSPGNVSLGILGIPLGLDAVVNLLTPILNPLLTNVDNLLIEPLAKALGLNIGGGDVGAIDMHCTGDVALVG